MTTDCVEAAGVDVTRIDVGQVLQEQFGFDQFLPGQREVIEHLLAGRSAAAVFPTGGGKSLCYQLPALLLEGVTIVVSPLIALMKDQIDALAARGIAAARLDSTLSLDEYRTVMDRVRQGQLKLLYVAPERFNNERFRGTIQQIDVAFFAVDEAHCISEWGHNFRPDYLKLAHFARLAGAERILALTATATPEVLADMCRQFEIAPECAVQTGFYRPNLTLLATPVETTGSGGGKSGPDERDTVLQARFTERPRGASIVYVTLQRTAEEVAARLALAGLPARAYHAGMQAEIRSEVQEWFMAADDPIVVATIAFGMGIDKADIRYVYHYNLPKSLENYSQEVGRAGRDGDPATCEMLLAASDLCVLQNFVYGDTPAAGAVRELVEFIGGEAESFDVSLYELSRRFDIRLLVVRTLLTYLELDGILEGGTPFYSQYKFKPLKPSAEMLAAFDDERRAFLTALFRRAKKGRTWLTLDVDRATADLHVPRERIVRTMDYLAEQGWMEVQTAGVRLRFRRLTTPADSRKLARTLHERMRQREGRELDRLQQVLDWAGHDGCQVGLLGSHFGDAARGECGHCSWCHDQTVAQLAPRPAATIDEDVWQQALDAQSAEGESLADPRRFALFLCGVSSPRLVQAKLTRHELFGALAHVPFDEVLERAGA